MRSELFRLAWPGALTLLLGNAYRVNDLYWVGLQGVYENAVVAAGHTLPVFFSTTTWNLSRIPLCWLLGIELGYGLAGVWWAINLSTYGKALTASWIVHRRRWQSVEL